MGNSVFLCRRGSGRTETYTTTAVHDPSMANRMSPGADLANGRHQRNSFRDREADEDDEEEEAEHSMYENRPGKQQQQQQQQQQQYRSKSSVAIVTNPLYEDVDNNDDDKSGKEGAPVVNPAAAAAAAAAAIEQVRAEAAGQRSFLLEQSHPEVKQPDPVLL